MQQSKAQSAFMLDNSGLATFAQCQRKYALSRIHHRASRDERIATVVGTAVHEVAKHHLFAHDKEAFATQARWMEVFTNGIFDSEERLDTLARFASAIDVLKEHYPTISDKTGPMVLDQQLRKRWIVRYPEHSFIQPLAAQSASGRADEGRQFAINGRIDCIVEDGNQQMWILELKTSRSATNSVWRDQWRMSTQPLTYTFAGQRQLSKLLAGVIIIPMQMNKRQAIMTPEIIIRPSEQALEEWQETTRTLLREIALRTSTKEFLPTGQYAGHCSSAAFGKCDFFDYCRSGCNPAILEQLAVREWNPLAQAEELIV